MTDSTPSNTAMDAILAQLAEVRASLVALHSVVEQQQSAIAALQQGSAARQPSPFTAPLLHSAAPASDHSTDATDETPELPNGMTTRRNLLRGAAAATAAATVGAAALSAAPTAHAADGGNLILGNANTASSQTTILDTASNAAAMFEVWNNAAKGPSNVAIYGMASNSSSGVLGQSASGYGVMGYASNYGWGVVGQALGSYDFVANGSGLIGVNVQSYIGAPTAGNFTIGDCIRDWYGELWLCTGSGNPGTWVKVLHLAPGATSGGVISYLPKPIRLFDSRAGSTDAAVNPGVKCSSSAPVTVHVAGVTFNGVTTPGTLAGAIGNVTVLNETGGGYLELVPSGAGFTGAANLAFAPGQVVSNSFNVALATGALDIVIGGGSAVATDVIVDLFAVVA